MREETHTSNTESWRRQLGQRVAIATIAGTVVMAVSNGLAPHWRQWVTSLTLIPASKHVASGPTNGANPWIMALALWILTIISSGILWGIARQVLGHENTDIDPDQHDSTGDRNNSHRTWNY